jgi:hypothetical protein
VALRPRTGAANFSASGLKRQDNDLIVIESAEAAANFKRNFDARFASGEAAAYFDADRRSNRLCCRTSKIAKSRLHMNAISLRTILVAVCMAYGVCFSARAEDAAAAYQSRYSLTGTLVRAAAVCAHDKKSVKSFLEAGVAAINNPELKKFTKAFPSTTEKWMKDGATTLNDKVMAEGIPSACKFAQSERLRALEVAKMPLSKQGSSEDTQESAENIEYAIKFEGTCNSKFLHRDKFLACDPIVTFTNYKNHRSAFTFTAENSKAGFIFEGGRDRQPDLENYYLLVDKVKLGTSDGEGAQGKAEGECHMRLNKDGSKYYEVKCDVFNREARFVFNFYLTDISSFEKAN